MKAAVKASVHVTPLPANSQNYSKKQIDSITKADANPVHGDWYICCNKMLELQPDCIYMKKSFYANLFSTSEGHTGEEKWHGMEIHDARQMGNLR